MVFLPHIPDTAPFTPEQRAWLNGLFAGLFSRSTGTTGQPHAKIDRGGGALQPLTILFGSQTGTTEALAKKAAKAAGQRGFAATVLDMAQADVARLAGIQRLLVLTSTYGDGEPPDNAKALHTALKTKIAMPKGFPPVGADGTAQPPVLNRELASVRYSVCSLGDSNYHLFGQCGKDFDQFLEMLGARRIAPRADCDVDYDAKFSAWLDQALAALASGSTAAEVAGAAPDLPSTAVPAASAPDLSPLQSGTVEGGFGRQRPFPAPVLAVRRLSGPGSAKEVNHVEFSLADSGLTYEVGDALGVFPQNCPEHVAAILAALGCDGEEEVPSPDQSAVSLRRALTEFYDLGRPSPELLSLVGAGSPAIAAGSEPAAAPASAERPPHHVIDALLQSKIANRESKTLPPAAFTGALRRLQPRLYSIASSPRAHAGQVHLTVGAVRYEWGGRGRKGVCSTFLAERAAAAGRVGIFVHRNAAFRLPPQGDTPVIMVGPGTGLAPFRGFLADRQATGARGRTWLFFGDQRESSDFLYREELLGLHRAGQLTRLDLAWSRDQAAKVYVQHRMLEQAAELFAWLEAGAHFYVCGDASRMAKDVDAALHLVIERAGGRTADQAADYVQALRAARRYQRDVY